MKIKLILILISLFLSFSYQMFTSTQKLEDKTEKAVKIVKKKIIGYSSVR